MRCATSKGDTNTFCLNPVYLSIFLVTVLLHPNMVIDPVFEICLEANQTFGLRSSKVSQTEQEVARRNTNYPPILFVKKKSLMKFIVRQLDRFSKQLDRSNFSQFFEHCRSTILLVQIQNETSFLLHRIWSIRFNHFHDQLVLSSSSDSRVILTNTTSISSEPFGHLAEEDEPGDMEDVEDGDDEHRGK